MNYDEVENLSENEIKELYNDVLEGDYIAKTWTHTWQYVICDNGEEGYFVVGTLNTYCENTILARDDYCGYFEPKAGDPYGGHSVLMVCTEGNGYICATGLCYYYRV